MSFGARPHPGRRASDRLSPDAIFPWPGEMATRVRAHDWSATALGPVAGWPQSLRTTVGVCLTSEAASAVAWGPDHVTIYNDGYRGIWGGLHPRPLGRDFATSWAAAWPVIGGAFMGALGGAPMVLDEQQVFVERWGYLEEAFFDFSFSPIIGESGGVGGVVNWCAEITARRLRDRRGQVLRDLVAALARNRGPDELYGRVTGAIAAHGRDLPFFLIYALDDERSARLVAHTGLDPGGPASPHIVALDLAATGSWPLASAAATGLPVRVDDLEERFGAFTCGPYPEPPRTAIALPVVPPGGVRPAAVLVAGISPRLSFDAGYRGFLDRITGLVSAALVRKPLTVVEPVSSLTAWTRARQTDEAVRLEHDRFFQRAPVAMASLRGPSHVYELANAEHARLTGREDVVGHGIRQLFPDLAAQGVIDLMDRVFATGEPFTAREMPIRFTRERPPVHVDLTLRAVPDGVMFVAVDVTEPWLERQRIEAQAETLRQDNRRKDELLAMLAHELRNPLTPIRLSIDLLRRRLSGAGVDRLLGTIERQTKQVIRIVDDLLEVSRLTRRKIELRREPLDLGQALISAVEAVRPTIEAGQHQLEVSLPDEPLVALVDPVRIEQVLVNLLANAAKYTEPPGHIWISLARDDGGAEIRVRDDGIGLTPEMAARVFDMFEQGSHDVARTQGGLGIGLAIVRSLVELHDGSVEARSPGLGQGCEFIVRLPVAPASTDPPP